MPVLKHGFSLGLAPNLLKTGFISSEWPYLGKGGGTPWHLEGPALLISQVFICHF